MKTCISLLHAALLALAVTLAAQAQPISSLQNVSVVASRIEQRVTDVVADVSIIEREQIDRLGSTTVAQLLAHLPGLQTIAFGDAGRIYIRGADSRMTALYLDGVRVDSQDGLLLGGGVPWELIPVSQIERIEVLRGAASAVYGADAMGGVIQIFTRRGASTLTPFVNLGLGSFNTQRINAGVSGAQGGWDYALGLGREDSAGFNTRPDLVHQPEREASASRSASLRLGYQLAPTQRLELAALDSQLDSHYVPWGGGTDYQARANLGTTALKWQSQWSDVYSTRLTLARSRVAKRDDVPYDFQTTLQSVLFENNVRLPSGILSAVLEQKKDDFDSKPSGYFDPAFRGERSQNALALGYGAHYGRHSVQFNARTDNDSLFGSHQTGALAYGYAFAPNWRATLASGSAFRAPTLEQSFGPYGSAGLAPETNHNSEASVGYTDPERSFKAVVYRNAISNMISSSAALTSCDASFFCYYNVGQASIRGVTVSASAQFLHYQLRGSLDLLDPVDQATGRTLSLRARRVMTLGLERQLAGWQLGAELQGVGERFDDAANSTVLPGYVLFNLNTSRKLNRAWQLVLRVDNASDVQYSQVGHYATPGRTFYAGFQWRPEH